MREILRRLTGFAAATTIIIATMGQPSTHDPLITNHDRRPALLLPLYGSFVTLQALDVMTTMRALNQGGHEANPLMAGAVGSPAAFVALKAASTVSTVIASEKLRRDHPVAAVLLMVGVNSLMATVVAHNVATESRITTHESRP